MSLVLVLTILFPESENVMFFLFVTKEFLWCLLLQIPVTVAASDPCVQTIVQTSEAIVIPPTCALGKASSHRLNAGAMAAVRLPLLHVSNFKAGSAQRTREILSASYAILVLVLPSESGRVWTANEIEIVEVVADQVQYAQFVTVF